MLEYRTLRIPVHLVSLVRTALEARAHDFEGSGLLDRMNVNSTTHGEWLKTAAALHKLAQELK